MSIHPHDCRKKRQGKTIDKIFQKKPIDTCVRTQM